MRSILVPIAALLLSDALLLVGHGLLLTLLPVAAVAKGFSNTEVALTGSAYFLGFIFGCMASPYVVRRVGHIRSFAILATSYSAVALIFPMFPALIGWLLLRFLLGATISGLYTIIESWLNERSTGETRGTVLSIYTTINLLMITAGQQLFNLGSGNSSQLFAIAAILVSIAIIPVSLTLSLAPAPLENVKVSVREIWRQSRISFSGAVIYGLVTGAFWSLGPVYAEAAGLDTFQLALFMSATVLGGAVFQLPAGRFSDRHDRRSVLLILAAAGFLISMLLALLPVLIAQLDKNYLVLLAFLWGGAVMTQYSISLAHANDRAKPEDFVAIGSGMLLILGIFSAIGAPLAAWAMKLLGPEGFFLYIAACLLIFTVIIAVRRYSHKLTPASIAEPFRAVAATISPTAYGMDPRNRNTETSD